MMKILILGALPKTELDKQLYKSIIEACATYGEVSSPIDTAEFKGSEVERYERAFLKVKESDLIIAELSKPSTGQGMEIREATLLNKPLLVIAKKGSEVSGLVKACPVLRKIIFYDDLNNLKQELMVFLGNI